MAETPFPCCRVLIASPEGELKLHLLNATLALKPKLAHHAQGGAIVDMSYQGMRAKLTGEVAPNLDTRAGKASEDARRLAWAVLEGDLDAALLLADIVQEHHASKRPG